MDNSVSGASSRTRMSKDRIIAAEHAVDAAEAVHKTALLNLKRQKNLASSGLASTRAVETAEMEEARALTDLNRAKSALSAAKSEQNALLSDQMRFGTDGRAAIADAKAAYAAAQAELSSAQADLPRIQVRLSRQHSQIVRAPRDGTIMRILVYENAQMLKSGEHLAILIPDTMDRAVELWVDGNDVPLVSEGRSTSIQFQGWPIFQFSGWPNLAYGTFHGKVFLVDSTDNGSGKFRVLVRPEGKDWPSGKYLRQGVRANGWIFLNQVSLGYELWRKFNDFPPTIPFDSSHNLDSHGSGKKSKNEKK
jgi:biotin carboxyl carrier protein